MALPAADEPEQVWLWKSATEIVKFYREFCSTIFSGTSLVERPAGL